MVWIVFALWMLIIIIAALCGTAESQRRWNEAYEQKRLYKANQRERAQRLVHRLLLATSGTGGRLHTIVAEGNVQGNDMEFCRSGGPMSRDEQNCFAALDTMDPSDRVIAIDAAWDTIRQKEKQR